MLLVRYGRPEDVIPQILDGLLNDGMRVDAVYCSKEIASEEIGIEKSVHKKVDIRGVNLIMKDTGSMVDVEDLPFKLEKLPDVYTNVGQNSVPSF